MKELVMLGFDKNHCIHNGLIIRREPPYENMDIQERRHIINKMIAFTRQLDISFKYYYFLTYDIIKVYYVMDK